MPQPASCNGKWGPMANRTRENETTAKRFKYRAILKPNCFWEAFRKNPAHFLNRFSAHITAGPAGWHGYKEKERLCQQTSTCSSIYMCRLSIKWPACQFLSWSGSNPEKFTTQANWGWHYPKEKDMGQESCDATGSESRDINYSKHH